MGIMEMKMEATIVYWGYIGIMEDDYCSVIKASKDRRQQCARG